MYLTEGQTRYLAARADAAGITRSAVLRDIIDDAAARPVVLDDEVKRAFAALADEYAEVSARLFANDPDLSVDPLEDNQ
ncbi:MAG: hypothetical protein OXD34_13410 [bacterium]|nr:hypothetical protein [bacterium]